ncbi:hypothetical protein BU16DRAFT_525601 [Lophium mytilinum]|uniref:Mid2 domain-containing protein n=1 Tax=Lophium mytilinum TaxID=390894 RepID=A0A6A6R2G4_9PEZI|nr:hypothetical protein BU16DRAFT_525601 [Lophium mytilinum]
MSARIVLLLLLSFLLRACAQTGSTLPPIRSQNPNLIGYTKYGNSYQPFTCPDPSQTVTSSSSWWACGAAGGTSIGIATACVSSTIVYPGNVLYTCNPGYICNTGYLYSDLNDQFPLSEYGCLDGGTTSYYRSLPSTASAESTAATFVSLSATGSAILFTFGDSTYTLSTPTVGGNISGGSRSPSSKAWIAGVVVGPIFGIAILVGLGFLIYHLRKRARANELSQLQRQPAPTTVANAPEGSWVCVPTGSAGSPPPSMLPPPQAELPSSMWPPQRAELSSLPRIREAPGLQRQVELEAGGSST